MYVSALCKEKGEGMVKPTYKLGDIVVIKPNNNFQQGIVISAYEGRDEVWTYTIRTFHLGHNNDWLLQESQIMEKL